MTKKEFLDALDTRLRFLTRDRRAAAENYQRGLIDGRMECGLTEERAVALSGEPAAVAERIVVGEGLPRHRVSSRVKKLPPVFRVLFTGFLSAAGFAAITVLWAALLAAALVTFLLGALGVLGVVAGIIMCFIRTVPVGLCVSGAGMALASVMILLSGSLRVMGDLFLSFSRSVSGRVRFLVAREERK